MVFFLGGDVDRARVEHGLRIRITEMAKKQTPGAQYGQNYTQGEEVTHALRSRPAPSGAAAEEPNDQQQHNRTDRRVDDRGDHEACAEMQMKLRQEPAAYKGASDADNEIAENAKPGALHDLACKPSGNHTHYHNDDETFVGHVHGRVLLSWNPNTAPLAAEDPAR
jgi:hypothetical protein